MEALRSRLAEAEETLSAIRNGEVDALVVSSAHEQQVFTLKGADHAYRVLFEQMNEAAATLGVDGTILFANDALASLLKIQPEKTVGSKLQQYLHDVSVPAFNDFLERSLQFSARQQMLLRTPEGGSVPVLLSGRKLDHDNGVRGISVVVSDLTLQKQAEEVLRRGNEELENLVRERTADLRTHQIELEMQNEALRALQQQIESAHRKFADLYNHAPVGYFSFNTDGVVIDVNDTGTLLLERDKNAVLSKPFLLFIEPGDRDIFYQHARTVHATGTRQTCDLRLRRNGKTFHGHLASVLNANVPDERFPVIRTTITDITERKSAEEALERTERRYRELLQTANSAIIRWKCDGTILFFNDYALEFFGYQAGEVVGKHINILLPGEQSAGRDLSTLAKDILERPEQYAKVVNENIARNGRRFWMAWTNKALMDDTGRVTEVLAIGVDITDRKKTEDALQASEERFRMLFEKAGDAIFVLEAEGENAGMILSANRAAAEMHGYSIAELTSMHIGELDSAEDASVIPHRMARIHAGEWLKFEVTHRRHDGSRFPIEVSTGLIVSGTTKIVLAFDRDITERKKAEEALRQQEELYRTLAENSPDYIARHGRDYRYLYVNKKIAGMQAMSPEDFIGKSPEDVGVPPQVASEWYAIFERVIGSGRAESSEHSMFSPGGRHYLHRTVVPEFGPDGTVQSVLAIGHDITNLRQTQEALVQSEARLRALFENAADAVFVLEAEGEFAGMILAANRAAAEMHGYSIAELKEMNIRDLVGPADATGTPGRISRIASGEWLKFEVLHRRKDGSLFPLEVSGGLVVSGDAKFIFSFDRDITERKKAEHALRESREQYLRLFNTVSDGIAVHPLGSADRPGNFAAVNDTLCRMLGYSEEEMQGLCVQDVILQEDVADAKAVREALRQYGMHIHQKTLLTRSGARIPVEISSRVFDNDGVHMAISVIRDITDRKAAEDRISHQHGVLNAINLIFREALHIENETDLLKVCLAAAETVTGSRFGFIAELDRDGTLHNRVFSDPGWDNCSMPDKTTAAALKMHGIYSRAVIDRRSFFTNDPASHPHRVGLPPGHPPLTAFLGVPLIWRGEVIGMIGLANREGGFRNEDLESLEALAVATIQVLMSKRAAIEITRLNQDLRRKVSEMETIFNTAPIGLAIAEDVGAKRIRGNQALQQIAGIENEEFSAYAEQRPKFQMLREDDEVRAADLPMQRAVRGETISELIMDLRRADGRTVKLLCSATPLLDESGMPRGAVGAFLDITLMVHAEQEIAKLNRELRQNIQTLQAANRELEAFVYSVSHDLRAPLRSIKGFSDFLFQDYEHVLDDRGKDYLNRVVRNTAKMDQIIDDLLHLSRISRQQLGRTDVDISQLVAELVAELPQGQHQEKATVLIQQGVRAQADPRLIRAAFGNLLKNAWKFTSKTASPRIEFGVLDKAGQRVFFVRDNGAGFDQAYSDKLFLPFHRLHSEQEFEGSGIGLAIVERVMRKHGGRIWAEGKPGESACFYFTLE